MSSTFVNSCLLQFRYYKELGEKTIEQVPEIKLSFQINNETNSINTIVNTSELIWSLDGQIF